MNKLIGAVAATAVIALFTGAAQAEKTGKEVYESRCFVCHASGVAQAPKFGDANAWSPRIAKGVNALVDTVKAGKNAMPPMGTCMECSDKEVRSAVEYMVSNGQ